jgi:hypothetical protein
MHTPRELIKKEAKSLLVFATTYAIGVLIYFQLKSAQNNEIISWVLYGATLALVAYVLPALWRLMTLVKNAKK